MHKELEKWLKEDEERYSKELENCNSDKIEEDFFKDFLPYDVDKWTKEDVLSDWVMDYLVNIVDSSERIREVEKVKDKAREFKVTKAFNELYKQKNNEARINNLQEKEYMGIVFPEKEITVYKTTRYEIDEDGRIFERNPKMGNVTVCYHPILPIEKYKNLEDGTERVKLAFYKNNKWEYSIVDKTTISSNQNIVSLSAIGIAVTSENSKSLIKYLAEIENLNLDKIETRTSISRLGWVGNEFVPYATQYIYDGDLRYKGRFEAVKEKGDYEKWKTEMRRLRSKSKTLRLIMAASFAAPLVKKLQINSFIVHLWGKSGGGKTVTQMIAASIWGNPSKGKLLNTLNNTDVASELYCNFMHNLPVIYDEYQIQKDKNANFDTLIYELTEGKGKGRGTADCGLKPDTEWDTIFILSGEQPITNPTSKEGVKNRVIEVEDNNTIIENGMEVVDFITGNYGFAGKAFIQIIQHKKDLFQEFKEFTTKLMKYTNSSKQINAMAAILLADKIVSEAIFQDSAISIEEAKEYFSRDIEEADRYINLIIDIANSNRNNFGYVEVEKSGKHKLVVPPGQIWGYLVTDATGAIEYYDFIPIKLKEILKNNGIDWDGIKAKMAKKEYVIKRNDEYTINRKIGSEQQRVIRIKNINFNR